MVILINLLIILYCIEAYRVTYTYDKRLTAAGLPKPPLSVKLLLGLTWPLIRYRYWQLRRQRNK